MEPKILLDKEHLALTINRLAYQLIENHNDFSNTVIIGLQPRGVALAKNIHQRLSEILPDITIPFGLLDITFFRDDFRSRAPGASANTTQIDFTVEQRNVILIDDVLYTGRSIRSGMDALMVFGRPKEVELLVLVERRFSKQLPIKADYVGRTVDVVSSEWVEVSWKDQEGTLILKSREE